MPPGKRFIIVFVVDGLRPDAITPEDTPTLFRLRGEGVDFTNGHSVFPTVTRVNAASLSTGTQPGTHGIVGNQTYVPAVDPTRAFDTGNYRNLVRLDEASGGRLLLVPTLAERLHARGLRLAGVSSGSTGSAFLLNPKSPSGVGVLVNGYLDPGKTVAYPPEVSATILAKFGPAPVKQAGATRFDASVTWTQRVLREYVLPELHPTVVLNWLTEPDHSQHHVGVGSPASREALRNDDREIAAVLATLDDLDLTASTDVLVVSDHGFTTNTAGVDVARFLVDAGLKASPDSGDVVLASSGQAVALYVEGHDGERITRLARFVRSQEWGGVVFTAGRAAGDPRGAVEGTFSLELIHAVGLGDFVATTAVELPYGRKRALEIATTLALDPEMMLLDEPTAGMAHEDVERISALIKRVAANRTVLMVEHNLSVVENLSDTITVLARGEVLAEGDYRSVARNPEVIQAYMGSGHA